MRRPSSKASARCWPKRGMPGGSAADQCGHAPLGLRAIPGPEVTGSGDEAMALLWPAEHETAVVRPGQIGRGSAAFLRHPIIGEACSISATGRCSVFPEASRATLSIRAEAFMAPHRRHFPWLVKTGLPRHSMPSGFSSTETRREGMCRATGAQTDAGFSRSIRTPSLRDPLGRSP